MSEQLDVMCGPGTGGGDDSGNALVDTDGQWSTPDYAHPVSTGSLTSVSCASPTFCVAVDLGGKAYFWDGSSWSAPQTISASVAFSSVSCPDTSFCVAGGQAPFSSPTKAYVATWSSSSAPAAPTNLHAAAGSNEVGLSWSAPLTDGGSPITGYTVTWRPTGAKKGSSSTTVAGLTTTITGLTNGGSYQFAVEAVNASGTGPPTGWVNAEPSSTPPPLEPVGLTGSLTVLQTHAIDVPNGEVDLHWSKPGSNGCPNPKCQVSGYMLSYTKYAQASPNVAVPVTVKVPFSATGASSVTLPLPLNLASDTFDVVATNGYGNSPAAALTLYLEERPMAPQVSASVTNAQQVTLGWLSSTLAAQTGVGAISAYYVYEWKSVHVGASTLLAATQYSVGTSSSHGETLTSVTITGLAAGTKYYFEVTEADAAGRSSFSAAVEATTLGPPAAPTGLAAVRADREVFLSWRPPTINGGAMVSGYQVFMGTSAGGEGATAVAAPSVSHVTLGTEGTHLANGTAYFFTVKAVNVVGTGPASNQVSSTPEPVAASPEAVVATPGGGQVKLAWQAPSSDGGNVITGYDVYAGTAPGAEAATPVRIAAKPTSYTVHGLTPGVTYYFYLAAVTSVGPGLQSDEVSAVPTAVLYPPSAPAVLTASRADREVQLSWQPGSDGGSPITGYQVFMGTAAGREGTAAVASPTVTHVTLGTEGTHLDNGTTYFFTVKAVSAVGTSGASNEASATPAAVASGPQDVVASAADGSVKLTWQAPGGTGASAITGYDIYQGTAPGAEAATPVKVSASPTSYTVTGLSELKTYYFYLTAVNSVGPGLASEEASATPQGAPGQPSDVQADAGNAQVGISWAPPSNDRGSPVTGYTVLWRLGAHATSTASVGASTTTYVASGLTDGDIYEFSVEATNAFGTSAATGWSSASPSRNTPPLAPEDLTAVTSAPNNHGQTGASTNGTVELTWTAPPAGGCSGYACEVTGYVLSYDGSGGLLSGVAKYIPGADTTSTGLTLPFNRGTDHFELSAVNSYGTSPAAEVAVPLEFVPSAPSVTATPKSRQVVLTWADLPLSDAHEQIGYISGYAVYEGTSARQEPATPLGADQYSVQTTKVGDAVDIQATVTELRDGTTYYFEVADIDAAGPSPLSNEVSATPRG